MGFYNKNMTYISNIRIRSVIPREVLADQKWISGLSNCIGD